ncbi:hypothetical protein [Maricaulis maris]|uniref:hypothetical protein n=1 Tax=Maricaulis maris TaxID=74318 RepID=UPI003B8DE814
MDPLLVKQWRIAGLIVAISALLAAFAALLTGPIGMMLQGLSTLFGAFLLADLALSTFNKGKLGRVSKKGFYLRRALVGAAGWVGFAICGLFLSVFTNDEILIGSSEVAVVVIMGCTFGAVTQPVAVLFFTRFLSWWTRVQSRQGR